MLPLFCLSSAVPKRCLTLIGILVGRTSRKTVDWTGVENKTFPVLWQSFSSGIVWYPEYGIKYNLLYCSHELFITPPNAMESNRNSCIKLPISVVIFQPQPIMQCLFTNTDFHFNYSEKLYSAALYSKWLPDTFFFTLIGQTQTRFHTGNKHWCSCWKGKQWFKRNCINAAKTSHSQF